MRTNFPKQTLVALFTCCRQAERSVHYALSCPTQWLAFLDYYDDEKQWLINECIALLKKAGADPSEAAPNDAFSDPHPLAAIPVSLVRLVLNKFKKGWSLPTKDLSFICAAFEKLSRIITGLERPSNQELYDLRISFCICQWIIEGRLLGVPELRSAGQVEHFLQSDWVKGFTLEQLEVRASLQGKGAGKMLSR